MSLKGFRKQNTSEEPCLTMTSSNGNIFRVTGPLCGEFVGDRWIPRTKANDVKLWCFLWSAPWINGWVNNREADDLRRQRVHYDVIIMWYCTHARVWGCGHFITVLHVLCISVQRFCACLSTLAVPRWVWQPVSWLLLLLWHWWAPSLQSLIIILSNLYHHVIKLWKHFHIMLHLAFLSL